MSEFNFRIINTSDGNQIIDETLKTPYAALNPVQYAEIRATEAQRNRETT